MAVFLKLMRNPIMTYLDMRFMVLLCLAFLLLMLAGCTSMEKEGKSEKTTTTTNFAADGTTPTSSVVVQEKIGKKKNRSETIIAKDAMVFAEKELELEKAVLSKVYKNHCIGEKALDGVTDPDQRTIITLSNALCNASYDRRIENTASTKALDPELTNAAKYAVTSAAKVAVARENRVASIGRAALFVAQPIVTALWIGAIGANGGDEYHITQSGEQKRSGPRVLSQGGAGGEGGDGAPSGSNTGAGRAGGGQQVINIKGTYMHVEDGTGHLALGNAVAQCQTCNTDTGTNEAGFNFP